MLNWRYSNDCDNCDCGDRQTMQHILICELMENAFDLTEANFVAMKCAKHGEQIILTS